MKVLKKLDDAIELLKNGKVGVVPTDTIYGVVASAHNEAAVSRVYELKQREGKPGTIIAANLDQLVGLGFKKRYLIAVEKFWPGAVSVVIPCYDLAYLNTGTGSVPVRIPDNTELIKLLSKAGPLQTSSANITGKPGATTIQQAQNYFGENIDFYVDGGDLTGREPSTVIRVVDDAIEVIRPGAVRIDEETGKLL